MGITSCYILWTHTQRCWLLVIALLPHPEITACRVERAALHSLCVQINWSPATITLQTQTLQPPGTAETRQRRGRDREHHENRKVQVQTRSALKPQAPLLGRFSSAHFQGDTYPPLRAVQTARDSEGGSKTINLPQLRASRSAAVTGGFELWCFGKQNKQQHTSVHTSSDSPSKSKQMS